MNAFEYIENCAERYKEKIDKYVAFIEENKLKYIDVPKDKIFNNREEYDTIQKSIEHNKKISELLNPLMQEILQERRDIEKNIRELKDEIPQGTYKTKYGTMDIHERYYGKANNGDAMFEIFIDFKDFSDKNGM